MKIGLTLSGGGIRATVFHLGVLARLAGTPLWDRVRHISTVSGGSLCAALVFQKSGKRWPSGPEFLEQVEPEIRGLLTSVDLQRAYKWKTFTRPWRMLQGRAHLLGTLLEELWGLEGCVSEMPLNPRWTINTTCYETGKNWRFSAKRMGDYLSGYVMNPHFPLSDAVAASAAVPGLIGPLRIDATQYDWEAYEDDGKTTHKVLPLSPVYHLWDGGIYENQGLEALYKPGKGLRYDLDYCLVSDASAPLGIATRSQVPFWRLISRSWRLVDIATDQVRSLRARDAFNFFRQNQCGGYIHIGESVRTVFNNYELPIPNEVKDFMSEAEVSRVSNYPTRLWQLTDEEYRLIYCRGEETCSAVLATTLELPYHPVETISEHETFRVSEL